LRCSRCGGPAVRWRGALACETFSCWEQQQLEARASRADLSEAEIEARFEAAKRQARTLQHLSPDDIYRQKS
jgi:uncharacterized Zn finger protein (UPF0148 family)